MGRVHPQGGFPPAQSEKAESWPSKVSGSQTSPQRLQCVCFVETGTRVASCDDKKSTRSALPREPRVRGVTASLGRRESGGRRRGSVPSTLSECRPLSRSRCTAKSGSVLSNAENGLWLLCWAAHLCHDLAILGQFEVLGQLFVGTNVSLA